ncbi:MAG: PAS domain S-box protein [Deltaproteobacteria bacterium]|nr:PAS domain S-box protein [Deltaproteobacteria bacterium]
MRTFQGYRGFFQKGKTERPEIEEVRRVILDRLLLVFSLLGLPAVVIGAAQTYMQGKWGFSVAYIGLYFLFVAAALASRQLPYRIRALVLVLSLYLIAFTVLVRIGMSGVGLQLLLGVGFLSAVLFGFRTGAFAVLFILASIGFVAAGMTTGFIPIHPEHMLTSQSAAAWFTAVFVFFMTVSITVIAPEMFSRRLRESLNLVEEHRKGLETANASLREEIKARQKVEATLRESEARFEVFMNHLPASAFMKDEEGRVLYANRFLRELFGWTDTVGKSTSDLLPPEMADQMVADDRAVLAEGPAAISERIVDREGKERFFQTHKFPIRIEGHPLLLGGIAVDITERKRAEEALRLSEATYREIFNTVNDTIWVHDIDTLAFLDVNNKVSEMFGYSVREALDLSVEDISSGLPPFTQDTAVKMLEKAKSGEPQLFEWQTRHKDGHLFWTEVSLKRGTIAGRDCLLAIERDITERKRAAEERQALERNYQEIFNAVDDAIFVHDLKGHILDVNQGTCDLMGYPREEILRLQVADLSFGEAPYSQEQAKEWVRRAGEEGPQRFEWLCRRKSGDLFWAEVVLKYAVINGTDSVLAVARDITERKQAAEALRESEERFEAMIRNSSDLVTVLTADGITTYQSPAIKRILGYDPEEMTGVNGLEYVHPEDLPAIRLAFAAVIDQGGIGPLVEYRYRHADGSWVHMEAIASNHLDDPAIRGVIVNSRDITERKQAEEALRERAEEYRAITNTSMDGFAVTDLDGRTLDVNDAYCRMVGYSRDELFRMSIPDIEALQTREEIDRRMQQIKDTGSDRFETRHRRKDGHIIDVEVGVTLMREESRLLTFLRDISEHKRAEEALRQSEATLKSIFKAAPVGISIMKNRVYQSVNDFFHESFGYAEQDILGKSPRMLYETDEEFERVGRELYDHLQERGLTSAETRLRRSDGVFRDVAITVAALGGGDPSAGTVGIIYDVTERKQAEEALRQSESRYRNIFENATVAIWEEDFSEVRSAIAGLKESGVQDFREYLDQHPEFVSEAARIVRVLDVNNHCVKSYGAESKEELLGSIHRIFLPETLPVFQEMLIAIAEDRQDFQAESLNQTLQGERRNILITISFPAPESPFNNALVITMDITERKKAEEALREKTEELESFFTTALDLLCIANTDGYFLRLNREWERVLGYRLDELEGRPFLDFVHPDDVEATSAAVADLESQKEVLGFTNRYRCKDGSYRWMEWRSIPVGKRIYAAARDVTERIQAEEELKKHRDNLEELVRERTGELLAAQEELIKRERLSVLGQLTATVSHELRNPLGVIRSSAFYLQEKVKDGGEKIRKHLKRIEAQVELCDSIVGELLEYTRGSVSEMTEMEITSWLGKVLDEAVDAEGILITRSFSGDLPKVLFDQGKMGRVITNLLDNAVHAARERLNQEEAEKDPYEPEIRVSADRAEGGVRIEVEDNGVGMDGETMKRAFDPLFTKKARGTGLGLAIVRKIVEEHGGTVRLESELYRGTKATLWIPVRQEAL